MNFFQSIKSLFASSKSPDEMIEKLEKILIAADVGPSATDRLLTKLSQTKIFSSFDEALSILKQEMIDILGADRSRRVRQSFATAEPVPTNSSSQTKPSVIYFVGVNGAGKTTTIAKFAHHLLATNSTSTPRHLDTSAHILMIAADTFRAAAIDQLKLWADRVGADFVGGQLNADPSSVIVDGLRSAKAKETGVVLVDTAGRLQTKQNLMSELQKMVRMTERELGKKTDEIFLVLDAVTGQNGLIQARIFLEAVPISGIILTKYDATAKGGIVFSVVDETKLPIRYLCEGEGLKDMREFDAKEFVERVFE